jgi:hypothetical protein
MARRYHGERDGQKIWSDIAYGMAAAHHADVEAPVSEAVAKVTSNGAVSQTGIGGLIDRVTIGRSAIQIQLSEVAEAEAGERTLTLPWTPPSPYRKRKRCKDLHPPDARQRALDRG